MQHVAGRRLAKVVMALAGTRLVMLVLPAPARVDLGRVAAELGEAGVRLAHEQDGRLALQVPVEERQRVGIDDAVRQAITSRPTMANAG